jgi:hypothetical protein
MAGLPVSGDGQAAQRALTGGQYQVPELGKVESALTGRLNRRVQLDVSASRKSIGHDQSSRTAKQTWICRVVG